MKIAVLFPGQGSQYLGMGQDFIENSERCASLLTKAEEICGLALGKIITEGPMEELTRNSVVQPAITLTNMICWESLKERLGDIEISSFAGHSLGEYSALYASGAISAEDCLKLVTKRGSLMEREGATNPGGMRAVIGLDIEQVEKIINDYEGSGVVTVANHNTPIQIVVSGNMEGLDAVTPAMEEMGAKVIALNVSVANHSPLLVKAVPEFKAYVNEVDFQSPQANVYFNVTGNALVEPATIKAIMGNQIISRVHWCTIINSLLEDGVDTFIEVGPKNVLKGMMRKIVPRGVKVTSMQFDDIESLDSCLEKLNT